ncbi:MAG: DUF5678 domain-containing protein [Rhizomicrobium sp.]
MMAHAQTKVDVQKILDNHAHDAKARLQGFAKSASVFSSNDPRLIDKYENKWVAVYNGEVVAVGESLGDIMRQLPKRGVPASDAMIRRIDRKERTLIL